MFPSLSDISIHYCARKINRFNVKNVLNRGPASKLTENLHSLLGRRADAQVRPIRPSQAEHLRLPQGEARQDDPASADLVNLEHFVFSFLLMDLLYHESIQLSS